MKYEGSIRSAKIAAFLAGAVGILLLLEVLLLPDAELRRAPRDSAIARLSGDMVVLEERPFPGDVRERVDLVLLGPDESSEPEAVIVLVGVPGYQSMIETAYRFDRGTGEVRTLLVSAVETAGFTGSLAEKISGGEIDTLSGATITREAVTRAEALARRYATIVFSEDE